VLRAKWNVAALRFQLAFARLDRFRRKAGFNPDQPRVHNNVDPTGKGMTPDQARSLLKAIEESQDPRIRNYNHAMRLLRRLFRLRIGPRGTE
jgi:hypothetical protein